MHARPIRALQHFKWSFGIAESTSHVQLPLKASIACCSVPHHLQAHLLQAHLLQ